MRALSSSSLRVSWFRLLRPQFSGELQKSCDFGVHLALNSSWRWGQLSFLLPTSWATSWKASTALVQHPQSLNLWNISSTLTKLHHDRTVGWSTEGATHRGPRWDTTLFILQDVTDALSHWALRWVICSPVGQNIPLWNQRRQREWLLSATRTPTDILLPSLDFDLCCLELWGFQGRFVSTRKTTVVPRRQKLKQSDHFTTKPVGKNVNSPG